MPLFCEICSNLLSVITTADTFHFRCMKCKKDYMPVDEDTLRYEQIKGTNLIIYKTILQNADKDPVNPKVENHCNKCGHNIVRQVRLGNDMRLINVCIKCSNKWIEGIE
jgi:DNA-directed RNA polymerase subunit M/transcription elongation factor TFIIS